MGTEGQAVEGFSLEFWGLGLGGVLRAKKGRSEFCKGAPIKLVLGRCFCRDRASVPCLLFSGSGWVGMPTLRM